MADLISQEEDITTAEVNAVFDAIPSSLSPYTFTGKGTFIDHQRPGGAVHTPGGVQKSTALQGPQNPLTIGQGKGGASPSIPTEPMIELPPAGTAAAKSAQLLELRDTLKSIASKLPPGEARSTYERAAKAAKAVDQVAKAKGLTADTVETIKAQILGVRT